MDLPDLGPLAYMAGMFQRIGFAREGSPLTFTEIDAFARLSALRLEPWEAEALRLMSIEYLAGVAIKDPNARPPREPE